MNENHTTTPATVEERFIIVCKLSGVLGTMGCRPGVFNNVFAILNRKLRREIKRPNQAQKAAVLVADCMKFDPDAFPVIESEFKALTVKYPDLKRFYYKARRLAKVTA